MAKKTIPTASDQELQREINWAQKTRDLIAAAFEGSVLKLIDNGITGLEGAPYLSTLIEDEEAAEDQDKFRALRQVIQDLAEKLPEDDYSHVCGCLEKADNLYYARMHLGADKMAEILIRFYLQTHWNFPTFGTGSQRNTRQGEQGSAAANDGEQEEAGTEGESATQKRPANSVLIAEGHLDRLGIIENQLVGLNELLNEADKYATVQCILEPIMCDLQRLTGAMHLFEERQKGGAA
ncbi:hypothetical protein MYX75_02835 [Acidobacteria bacterium AH-259-A15]|nr:hypothetical protein [Acidobacteria bacterium AH-259-A15]